MALLSNSCYGPNEAAMVSTLLDARRRHFGDGVNVLDIGANIGAFTIKWARHMDGWGRVLAFEAQERIFHALAGNVALNNCFNARPFWAASHQPTGVDRRPLAELFCTRIVRQPSVATTNVTRTSASRSITVRNSWST